MEVQFVTQSPILESINNYSLVLSKEDGRLEMLLGKWPPKDSSTGEEMVVAEVRNKLGQQKKNHQRRKLKREEEGESVQIC